MSEPVIPSAPPRLWQTGDYFRTAQGYGVLSHRTRQVWAATTVVPVPGRALFSARRGHRITVQESDLAYLSPSYTPVPVVAPVAKSVRPANDVTDQFAAEGSHPTQNASPSKTQDANTPTASAPSPVSTQPTASTPPPSEPPPDAPPPSVVTTPRQHRPAPVVQPVLQPVAPPPAPPTGPIRLQPPILLAASRYRVVPDDVIELRGHNLVQAVRVTIGGTEVHILRRTTRVLTLQLPSGPVNGTVEVTTPQGRATLARPLVAQVASQTQSPDPAPSPQQDGPAGWRHDPEWLGVMQSLSQVMPRVVRANFNQVANTVTNTVRAVQTAHSAQPYARGGNWVGHSIETSAYNRWQQARDRSERYAARATADPNNQHWQDRAQQAADIARQRGQQVGGAAVAGGVAGAGIGQAMGGSGITSGIAGAVGTAMGGPVAGAIASVVAGAIERAVTLGVRSVQHSIRHVFANIRTGGELGDSMVGHLADGVRSASRQVYDVGAQMAETLLDGLGAQFGPAGTSIARFGGQLIRSVGRTLEMAYDGVGNVLRGAGRLLGAGVVGAGALLGGVAGSALGSVAFGPIGIVLGGALGSAAGSAVGVALMRVANAVADMGGHIIATIGRVLGEIGGLAAGLVRTVMDVVDQARQSLLEYANAALDLSNLSGRSLGMSQNLLLSRSAFGMGYGQTASIYSNFSNQPLFTGAIKSAWGIHGAEGSEEEIRSVMERARNLPLMLRRVMMQSLPEGESFWARLVGMPDEKVTAQLEFFRNMDLGGNVMKNAAEDLTLLQSRWEGFSQWLLRTVAVAVLPIITSAMTNITNWLKEHQGEIQGWIMDAVSWVYSTLPSLLGQAMVWVGNGIQWMINAIVDGLGALRHMITPVAVMLDGIVTGARQAVIQILALAAAATAGPLGAGRAYAQTYDRLNQTMPNIDIMGTANAAVRSLGAAQRGARNALNPAVDFARWMIDNGNSLQQGQGGREQQISAWMREIARNTGVTADAAEATAQGVNDLGPILTQEIVHGSARRTARAISRMGG